MNVLGFAKPGFIPGDVHPPLQAVDPLYLRLGWKHDGYVESEESQGTTFTVYLPLNPKPVSADVSEKSDQAIESTLG